MRLAFILMVKLLNITALIIFCCLSSEAQITFNQNELRRLDHELLQTSKYDRIKYEHIDSLKNLAKGSKKSPDRLYNAMINLGKEYETFISDSSLMYFNKAQEIAIQLNDSTKMIEARLGKVKVLGILGLFKEGASELEDIERHSIPNSIKEEWLDTGRQLYAYMTAYTRDNKIYFQRYSALLNSYRLRQLEALDKNSFEYKLFLAEHYDANGENGKAKLIFGELLEEVPENSNIYARAAHNMSSIKDREGNPDVAAYYLAKSAISDIKCSVKENMSLQELAVYLYSTGDISHAYSYISASLADAVFCNARLRTAEVSKIMPLIDNAYKVELDKRRSMLVITIVIVSVLSICLFIAILLVMRQMKKVKIARQHLKEANSIKEEYIGHFLDLCSIYMDRLDNFCKIVTRKITAGQIEELVQMAKSSKFAENQHKQFYDNFDGTFLHIYPNFIQEFNDLLLPEERIIIREPGRLTTELRIFAFLRMGVEDSTKIANFLHYSVNTIYTYRNKMKNKAIDRDHFEENVMKIGYIS